MNSAVITILSLSVSGSILALILLAGKTLLKNRVSKAFSYYIWILVMLRLIVPVAAPVNLMGTLFDVGQPGVTGAPIEQTDIPARNEAYQIAAPSNTQTASEEQADNETARTQTPADPRWPLDVWSFIRNNLLWIWLTGAACGLGWFITAYLYFSRRIRRSCTPPHIDDLAVFEQMRGGRRVTMACSSHVSTPVLIGVYHPVIVLPQLAYVRNGMGEELKHILRHELTHYRRKDVLYKWLVAAVTSLHWFNPLMPWIRREMGRACELSCDEGVISGMSEREKQFYGNMLLKLSAGRKLPTGILTTTLCEDKEQLTERLVSIKKYKKKSACAVALTLVLALLLTGCAAALGAANGSTGAPASNTQAENAQIAAPFESVAAELLKTCKFPVFLPTYFPSPGEGNEWSLTPEVKEGTFSIEINRQPSGYTGQARSLADWYGVLSGNVGEPSEQPLEKQFKSGGDIAVNDIALPDGIKGKEYIDDPSVAGGAAIAWEKDGWSFFVTAYPDGDSSTINYANRIIGAISGQTLPGTRGKLCFIYNGNMPMTEVSWEAEPGVWYEIDSRDPNDVIKLLQSMKKLDGFVSESDSIDILNNDINFQSSGLEIQELNEPVKIDRATAIKNAEASMGESVGSQARVITAVLVKITQNTPINPDSATYLKDHPAWIVTFHGVTLVKNGPSKTPTVLADENVVIDAAGGDVLESFSYPDTQPWLGVPQKSDRPRSDDMTFARITFGSDRDWIVYRMGREPDSEDPLADGGSVLAYHEPPVKYVPPEGGNAVDLPGTADDVTFYLSAAGEVYRIDVYGDCEMRGRDTPDATLAGVLTVYGGPDAVERIDDSYVLWYFSPEDSNKRMWFEVKDGELTMRMGISGGQSTPAIDEKTAVPVSNGDWVWPVEGCDTITSTYGMRYHPIRGLYKFSDHIDIAGNGVEGAAVYAALAGTVSKAEFGDEQGNYIVISHDGGIETIYRHLSELKVSAGDSVAAGGTIGTVGKTGTATGPCLAFCVYVDGKALNPLDYLKIKS